MTVAEPFTAKVSTWVEAGIPEVPFHTEFLLSSIQVSTKVEKYAEGDRKIVTLTVNPNNVFFGNPQVYNYLNGLPDEKQAEIREKLSEFRQTLKRGIEKSGSNLGLSWKGKSRDVEDGEDPLSRGVHYEYWASDNFSLIGLEFAVKLSAQKALESKRTIRNADDIVELLNKDISSLAETLATYEAKGAARGPKKD